MVINSRAAVQRGGWSSPALGLHVIYIARLTLLLNTAAVLVLPAASCLWTHLLPNIPEVIMSLCCAERQVERAASLPSQPHDNTERLMAHLSRANSAKSASSSSSSSEEGDAKSLGVRSGKSMTSQRGRSVICVRLASA